MLFKDDGTVLTAGYNYSGGLGLGHPLGQTNFATASIFAEKPSERTFDSSILEIMVTDDHKY